MQGHEFTFKENQNFFSTPASSWRYEIPFTVPVFRKKYVARRQNVMYNSRNLPCVPTGINKGVKQSRFRSDTRVARARPSSARTSKRNELLLVFFRALDSAAIQSTVAHFFTGCVELALRWVRK